MITNRLLVLLLIVLAVVGCSETPSDSNTSDGFISFMRANPEKSSVYAVQNGDLLSSYHASRKMPLASTVKIIVALEFARQASLGQIKPDSLVNLDSLDLYYLPLTDGGAHTSWINYCNSKALITNNQVSLLDVAKGMIIFSSNANTEFLMDRLGLENINALLQTLGMTSHDKLNYIASGLLVYYNFDNLPKQNFITQVRSLSREELIEKSAQYHQKLKNDHSGDFKRQFNPQKLDLDYQKVWSDNLTASTTQEYALLMQKINSRTYFNSNWQGYIDQLLEAYMFELIPEFRSFEHVGSKGGSTAFVLTIAIYSADSLGNKTEFALFLNNLTSSENSSLSNNLFGFVHDVLTKPEVRKELGALKDGAN
ncbi:MAG: serine hydrolase [Chlorobiales bacterium]|nr:serine hydrolase [Chlorobiales bacterium]